MWSCSNNPDLTPLDEEYKTEKQKLTILIISQKKRFLIEQIKFRVFHLK